MKNLLAAPASTPRPEPARGLLQGVPASRVRLGYRKGVEVRFISHLDLLRELAPRGVEIRSPLEGRESVISIRKAKEQLGWEPEHGWETERR